MFPQSSALKRGGNGLACATGAPAALPALATRAHKPVSLLSRAEQSVTVASSATPATTTPRDLVRTRSSLYGFDGVRGADTQGMSRRGVELPFFLLPRGYARKEGKKGGRFSRVRNKFRFAPSRGPYLKRKNGERG